MPGSKRKWAALKGAAGGALLGAWLCDARDGPVGALALITLLATVAAVVRGWQESRDEHEKEHADGEIAASRRWRRWLGMPSLVAAGLTLAFIVRPTAVLLPEDPDCSWGAALAFGHQHGLQFGRDLVFTYGPLGYLLMPWFASATAGVRWFSDLLLYFSTALGVCLVAGRLKGLWRIGLIALLVLLWISFVPNQPQADLVAEVDMFCWGLLCLVETGGRRTLAAVVFVPVAVFGALGKVSLLLSAGLSVAAVGACLALAGHRRFALVLIAGFGVSFLAGWMLCGQHLASLAPFALNAWAMTSGYEQAMGWEPPADVLIGALLTAACAAGSVVGLSVSSLWSANSVKNEESAGSREEPESGKSVTSEEEREERGSVRSGESGGSVENGRNEGSGESAGSVAHLRPPCSSLSLRSTPSTRSTLCVALRVVLLAWLLGLLFLSWKHGLVRGDRFHPKLFFCFAPMVVVAAGSLPSAGGKGRSWANWAAVACCAFGVANAQRLLPCGYLETFLFRTLPAVKIKLRSLAGGAWFRDELRHDERLAAERNRLTRLPELIGTGRTDVFGNYLIPRALASDLNYAPRPVFLSYAAYNAALMELNEEFYRGTNAPPWVLFMLSPIDRRFAPLEDARTLRRLLAGYELAGSEGPVLLLRSNGHRLGSTRRGTPKLLGEGTVRPGERVDLQRYGETNLWMEVTVRPTLAGQARRLLYKPPMVRLGVWTTAMPAGRVATLRAPPPMLAAGFVASPLLLDTADVAGFYSQGKASRPAGYSVELEKGTDWCSKAEVGYRIYEWGRESE
jgi:hypothetical protein